MQVLEARELVGGRSRPGYDWIADAWSEGCYLGLPALGTLTELGEALKTPHGRAHWAGTETADAWIGYIEGALCAGAASVRVQSVMDKMSSAPLLALVIALFGCESPTVSARPATSARHEPVAAKSATDPAPTQAAHIAWTDAIAWRDWEDALHAAKTQNKSICVVVYADWCSNCKELAPEFAKPEVTRAAASLIMVRQDQDQHPAWLKERLGKYDSYVPRVFFLDPNGQVREDLQSGHPRYPYFYAPLVTDVLLANMRAAVAPEGPR